MDKQMKLKIKLFYDRNFHKFQIMCIVVKFFTLKSARVEIFVTYLLLRCERFKTKEREEQVPVFIVCYKDIYFYTMSLLL